VKTGGWKDGEKKRGKGKGSVIFLSGHSRIKG